MPKAKPKKSAKKPKASSAKKKAKPKARAPKAAAVAAALKPKKRATNEDPLADLPEEESETKPPVTTEHGPGYPEPDDFFEADEDEEDLDGKGSGGEGGAWSGDDEY